MIEFRIIVRGYHAYRSVWTPVLGELVCRSVWTPVLGELVCRSVWTPVLGLSKNFDTHCNY